MRTALLVVTAIGGMLAVHTAEAQKSSNEPPSAEPSASSRSTTSGGVSANSATRAAPADKVDTKTFADKLAIAHMFEIESSKLALERSKSEPVKNFARNMVQDHTTSMNLLKTAASKWHETAGMVKEMDKEHMDKLEKLRAAADAEFDRAYLRAQMDGHLQAVSLLIGYSQNGDNNDMKQIAVETMPIVQQHLDHAKKLEAPATALTQ